MDPWIRIQIRMNPNADTGFDNVPRSGFLSLLFFIPEDVHLFILIFLLLKHNEPSSRVCNAGFEPRTTDSTVWRANPTLK